MSEREDRLLIEDIVIAIENILAYTDTLTFSHYLEDSKTRHAVERNFEIIGEASARLTVRFKALHSQIEWRILKDFRNFIIHDYFGINHQIVWETIQLRLPGLMISIKQLM